MAEQMAEFPQFEFRENFLVSLRIAASDRINRPAKELLVGCQLHRRASEIAQVRNLGAFTRRAADLQAA